eukprot:5354359-Prymnesium_polylepis.1
MARDPSTTRTSTPAPSSGKRRTSLPTVALLTNIRRGHLLSYSSSSQIWPKSSSRTMRPNTSSSSCPTSSTRQDSA